MSLVRERSGNDKLVAKKRRKSVQNLMTALILLILFCHLCYALFHGLSQAVGVDHFHIGTMQQKFLDKVVGGLEVIFKDRAIF